jgi:integrase/recombinase XerD
MDIALEQFLQHLVVERGLAPLTVEAYAHDLTGLASFLKQTGRQQWRDTTFEDLQHYLDDL